MKFRSAVMGLAALGILAGFQSCKVARSEQTALADKARKEQSALIDSIPTHLKMDFYLADEGRAIPDFERPAPGRFMEGVIREGESFQLQKRVVLSSEKLFFGISDSVGNQRIVDASYEHRILTFSNQKNGDGHRTLLSYDSDHHQFFLPMSQLTQEQGESLSSLDLQILSLSLKFQDGSVAHVEIKFYVHATPPSAEQIRIAQVFHESKGVSAQSASQSATKKEWTILTERYTNPTSRSLYLWFSSAGVAYQLETELGVKLNWDGIVPEYRPSTENGFEPDLHRISRAPLRKVSLVFKSLKGEELRTMALAPEVSVPVEIHPGQTFDVDWTVAASSEAPICSPGERVKRMIWGCDTKTPGASFSRRPWPACARPQGEFAAFKEPFELEGEWVARQFKVIGEFKNDVKVTEETGPRAQSFLIRTSKPGSAPESSAEMYSCQGVF